MSRSHVDMARLSSKGQVVIPGDIRESLGLEEGSKFVVWGNGDTIIFKKIGRPSNAEIERLFSDSRRFAKQAGLRKSDVARAIRSSRKKV